MILSNDLFVVILSNYDEIESKKYANKIVEIFKKIELRFAIINVFLLDNYFTDNRDVCGYIYFWDT